MKSEIIKVQSQKLFSRIIPLVKPAEDVFNAVKQINYLGTGILTEDWKKQQSQFQTSIDKIILGSIDQSRIIHCERMQLKQPLQKTVLGCELNQLLTLSLNLLKEETRSKRSKSGQTTSTIRIKENRFQSTTKIGDLVKQYKGEFQKMIESRPSLKSRYVEERINRNIEQLKEKIKKTNKTSYFISPKRLQ